MSSRQSEDDPLLVGVISDTHGLLDPRALAAFEGVDHIIHAGDIGGPDILRGLRELAPVTAVRGNVDTAPWAWDLPESTVVELNGRRVLVSHIRDQALNVHHPAREHISVVVTGHSHAPAISLIEGVLYLNPGSAGRRRFHLPRAVALLRVPTVVGDEASPGSRPSDPAADAEVGNDPSERIRVPEATIVILEPGSVGRT